jgi:hypothetical protein
VLYVTKVKDSTSTKDSTAKNGQRNAVTMKDVVGACCNAKREDIDVNMKTATTVGNIKELMYTNAGKDETVLSCVPAPLAGTSKSDMGINTMVDTVFTPTAAIAIDIVEIKGMIIYFLC